MARKVFQEAKTSVVPAKASKQKEGRVNDSVQLVRFSV
jgi:hypothetical protein